MFDLREEHLDDGVLLTVIWGTGVLRLDQEVFIKEVRNLVARGTRHIRLDVAEVPELDSERIAELVMCMAVTAKAGGDFRLDNVHGRLRDALDAARVLHLLS